MSSTSKRLDRIDVAILNQLQRNARITNAELARAVIGGLLFATPTTLLIVPYLFAMLRKRNNGVPAYGVFEDLPNE